MAESKRHKNLVGKLKSMGVTVSSRKSNRDESFGNVMKKALPELIELDSELIVNFIPDGYLKVDNDGDDFYFFFEVSHTSRIERKFSKYLELFWFWDAYEPAPFEIVNVCAVDHTYSIYNMGDMAIHEATHGDLIDFTPYRTGLITDGFIESLVKHKKEQELEHV